MDNLNITNFSFLLLILIAVWFSFKSGERSGSKYMLQYLRNNGFLDSTGYIAFMQHVRKEKSGEKD